MKKKTEKLLKIGIFLFAIIMFTSIFAYSLYTTKDNTTTKECHNLCQDRGAMYGSTNYINNTETCTCVFGDYIGNMEKIEFFEKQNGEFIQID